MAQTSSAGRGAGAPPERSAVQKAAAEEEPREGLRVQAEGRRECSWVPLITLSLQQMIIKKQPVMPILTMVMKAMVMSKWSASKTL